MTGPTAPSSRAVLNDGVEIPLLGLGVHRSRPGPVTRRAVEQVDLCLVHWPVVGLRREAWRAMERPLKGSRGPEAAPAASRPSFAASSTG